MTAIVKIRRNMLKKSSHTAGFPIMILTGMVRGAVKGIIFRIFIKSDSGLDTRPDILIMGNMSKTIRGIPACCSC
jgi:hypothetical protein